MDIECRELLTWLRGGGSIGISTVVSVAGLGSDADVDDFISGENSFVRFDGVKNLLIDAITFDFSPDTVDAFRINATDDATVRDVEVTCDCHDQVVLFRIDVTQNALVLCGSNVTTENSTLVTPAGSEESDKLDASDGKFTPREEQ